MSHRRGDLFVLFDMGGSTIKAMALYLDSRIPLVSQIPTQLELSRMLTKTPTLAAQGPAKTMNQFGLALEAACRQVDAKPANVKAVATCVPTPFAEGKILFGTNLGSTAWNNFPIEAALSKKFGVPAVAMNDGVSQGSAEANFSTKKIPKRQLYVGWGTGFAGDFSQNGVSLEGGVITELGHFTAPSLLHVSGFFRQCGCGQANHVEALGGSPALAYRASQAVEAGLCPLLLEKGWRDRKTFDQQAGLVLDCAQLGDAVCLELLRYCGQCVGCAFSASVTVLDLPDRFVVGGGIAALGDLARAAFMEGVVDAFRKTTWRNIANDPNLAAKFIWAKLGNFAGCLGTLPKLMRKLSESPT